jgi:DNA-binding NarL/FixJ family response regulator
MTITSVCPAPPATTSSLLRTKRAADYGQGGCSILLGYLAAVLAPDTGSEASSTELARELEVLALIALGHINGEIGDQLFLSVLTVETTALTFSRS